MAFTNPADDPLRPFVYEKEPYPGSGPHIMTACFIALGVKVTFTVDCVQFDETLVGSSVHTAPLTDDDLAYTGRFRSLPNGSGSDDYDARPIIEAAFNLAKRIAGEKAEKSNAETFQAKLEEALEQHYK